MPEDTQGKTLIFQVICSKYLYIIGLNVSISVLFTPLLPLKDCFLMTKNIIAILTFRFSDIDNAYGLSV